MKKEQIAETEAKELIKGKLSRYFGVAPSEARKEQLYKAVVMSVRDIMLEKRHDFHLKTKKAKAKRVYYLCMEFLMGRSLKNSIYNLGVYDTFSKALKDYDVTLEDLYELLVNDENTYNLAVQLKPYVTGSFNFFNHP